MEDPVLTELPRHKPLHRPQLDVAPAATTISSLYPELLALIFSYLEVRDKGRAAQVCVTWRDASYNKSVWRGTEAKLHLRRYCPTLFHSLVRRGIRKVQVLSLRKSVREVIHGMPNIESLNLSGCYNINDNALSHAFFADIPTLTKLDLSVCKQMTDNSLGKIVTHLKNLEYLELGGCSNITNAGLLLVAWGLKNLKSLNLRSCWYISDQGIAYIAGMHKESAEGNLMLEYLGLQDCQKLTDDSLKHISQGLPNLQRINLSFCISISDSGLKYLAKMNSLRELNLRACDNISDIGIGYLAEGGSRVSTLDVSFCVKLSDQALMHLSQGLFNLRALSMSACQISDEGVCRLAKTLHELETLNIGQCHRVTDRGLMTIAESLTHLRSIDLYGCTRITPAGIERIMKLPELDILNLRLWHIR